MMFTRQKIITIPSDSTELTCQELSDKLKAEIDNGWHIVPAIKVTDGIVVVLEGVKHPVNHNMLPVY